MSIARGSTRHFLLAATIAVVGLSCSEQRTFVAPPDAELKVDVTASKADAVMMVRTPSAPLGEREGSTLQLDASIRNPQGYELEHKQHTEWLSTDPAIATVDSTGLVTAQGVGSVFIIVDHKKSSDTVDIVVIPVPVKSVTLAGVDSVLVDDTTTFVATALDSVGVPLLGRKITFATSAPEVASIAQTGEAIALAVGTTSISAECEGNTASRSLRVWPQPVVSITVAPSPATVPIYRSLTLSATLYDRRHKVLTGRTVTWASSNEPIASVSAAGVVSGIELGNAQISATSEGITGTTALTVTNPVEARALWVTRFDFANAADIATVMQRAASANFNVVFFQVRAAGDAFYTPRATNPLEPCSYRVCGPPRSPFTGTMGGVPQRFDALAVAIAEAAKYGIEVHAWLNALTGWISGNANNCGALVSSDPLHMVLAHPDWVMANISGTRQPCLTTPEYIWVSPGIPEARSHLAAVAADIARRYDIKGIHLDRIRYPGTGWSYDLPSTTAFRNAYPGQDPTSTNANWRNMRRGFVNAAVKEVYDSLMAIRPSLVLSAAIWPTYTTMAGWGTAYSKGYDDYFQDPRAWARGGYLDVAAPMTYPGAPSTTYTVKSYCTLTDWTCLLDDQRAGIETAAGRHVYIGVGAVNGWSQVELQIKTGRQRQVTGFSVYNYTQVNSINGWALLKADLFKYPASIPPRTWK